MRAVLSPVRGVAILALLLAACGEDDPAAGDGGDSGRPTIVVTTNILGDIVGSVVGDAADVEVVMPLGADPHDFAPSTRQAEAMAQADLLVVNGAGFEEGMVDLLDAAEDAGAPVFRFADHVELRALAGGDDDPHIWTDPAGMVPAVEAFGARAAELDGIDAGAVAERAAAYVDELEAVDAEVEDALAAIPAERRVLVTNHEVFGYFAARYDLEVVGAVIPSPTTTAEASAADVDDLAALIVAEGVPAIFGEASGSTRLADALAEAVGGDVEVVELFTESLGEDGSGAETYLGLLRTDARLIADALT